GRRTSARPLDYVARGFECDAVCRLRSVERDRTTSTAPKHGVTSVRPCDIGRTVEPLQDGGIPRTSAAEPRAGCGIVVGGVGIVIPIERVRRRMLQMAAKKQNSEDE